MIVAGIDPGREGGVGFLDTRDATGWGELVDTADGTALAELLRSASPSVVALEVPVGRPPQTGGYAQVSRQWRGIGVAEGVVLALGLPLVRVQPREWQAVAFRGQPKPSTYTDRKRLSLRLARERWPSARLGRAKDGAIGEALWVALTAAAAHADALG